MLCTDFNIVFGQLFLPLLKLGAITVFVSCFFAVVRLQKILDAFAFVMLLSSCMTGAVLLVPMSIIMSSLYDISCKFKPNILAASQKILDARVRTQIKYQIESCMLVRCQIGSFYHMEAKAKLTLLQQLVNYTVYLMVNISI